MPVRMISLAAPAQDRLDTGRSQARNSPQEAYWRKGHWRRQAYGPARSMRRWVWIEPALCNSDAEIQSSGSIYHASVDDLGA